MVWLVVAGNFNYEELITPVLVVLGVQRTHQIHRLQVHVGEHNLVVTGVDNSRSVAAGKHRGRFACHGQATQTYGLSAQHHPFTIVESGAWEIAVVRDSLGEEGV